MKVVITVGGEARRDQSVIEFNEKWTGPGATKWLHRHPALYWATLGGCDRFKGFLKPYLLNPNQAIRSITIELKVGREAEAFSTLAHRILGHKKSSESSWVEQGGLSLYDYIGVVTGYSTASLAAFSDLVRVRQLDLIKLTCDESLFGPDDAIAIGKREPLKLELVHISSSTIVYELSPVHLSLYFVALLVVAIMTSGEFITGVLDRTNASSLKGKAANRWFVAASAAEKRISMGHTAGQVAGLFVPLCRAVTDQIATSKPLAESKPGGRAKELVYNMADAMRRIAEDGYYEFGSSFCTNGAPFLNEFLHELTPEERANVAMYLAGCVQPLQMISHAEHPAKADEESSS